MFSLQKVRGVVQKEISDTVPVKLCHRMSCGIQAFSLNEFVSINANGRSLALNRKTGESRVYRTLHDKRTVPLLLKMILKFVPKNKLIYCSLDHSQFGPFCIAVLAVSFRKGRALPIWCQINISKAGLMKPLLRELKVLSDNLPEGTRLVLVMDRWFCGQKLFNLIASVNWYFICRVKYGGRIEVPWDDDPIPIGEISHFETVCWYKGMKLRMVRPNLKPGMKENEPWFLLTNLPDSITRRQIVNRYAERFEIEESFKDVKWLNRMEWQQVKKPSVIQALLLFIFFGRWIFWFLSLVLNHNELKSHNPKHQLSWFRITWEMIHRLSWPDELRFTPLTKT